MPILRWGPPPLASALVNLRWLRGRGGAPRAKLLPVAAIVAGLAMSACSGGAGSADGLPKVRTVTLVMTEMTFTPEVVRVKVGEVVRFRFVNKGTVRHEAVIGDQAAQDKAVEMMREMDAATSTSGPSTTSPSTTVAAPASADVGGPRAELVAAHLRVHPGMGLPNMVSVEAGQTAELTFSFATPGEMLIGCHEAGHYEAGMHARLIVTG